MAAALFQVAAAMDTLLARDRVVNTLYFEAVSLDTDWDALCLDLANIFKTDWYGGAGAPEIRVKAYDVGSAPNFPKGEGVVNETATKTSDIPREVALCLSFYAERNLPRQRGRIYLCAAGAFSGVSARPSQANMQKALALGDKFAALGGANVSWNVHSQVTGQDHEVTHAWVDDEWDTMRSRGLRPTTRLIDATGS